MKIIPSDESLNIAICEWRGWTRNKFPDTEWSLNAVTHATTAGLPSHITGIEAAGNIKQARESLIGEERDAYEEFLRAQIGRRMGLDRDDYDLVTPFDMMQAEDREHAIALLRVVKPEMFQ